MAINQTEKKSESNKKYYETDTKWYVSLDVGDVVLRPMNPVSDRPETPEHLAKVLASVRSIGDTKGDACIVTCRIYFNGGKRSTFFHYFMDGCCEKELRGKVYEQLKSVPESAITRNGSAEDLDAFFS